MAHAGLKRRCITCEVKTDFTSVSLPAILTLRPFHAFSLPVILSTTGWKSTLFSLVVDKGRPRYLIGKLALFAARPMSTGLRSIPWQHMGMTVDFWKFVLSPVTSPKELRILARVRTSSCNGATKRAASSAYMEMRKCGPLPLSLVSAPISVTNSRILCKGSIARTNRSGERGSPCHRPLP